MNISQSAESMESETLYYLDVLLRRRWIVIACAAVVAISVTLVTFMTKPVYQATSMLLIEKERGGGAIYGNGVTVESNDVDYYQTQYKLLQSESLIQQVYNQLDLQKHEDFSGPRGTKRLLAAIQISPLLRSRLVHVRASSHDPVMAAKISNTLSRQFVDQNLSNQLFISKEVLEALRLDHVDDEARRIYSSLPAVVNNALIQNLKAERARVQAEVADLSKRYTARHPRLTSAQSRLDSINLQIGTEMEKVVQSLKTDLSGQLRGNNVRIVDPAAVPDKPIKPRKRIAITLGLIGGLALGFALALLVETLDQTIRSQEDVEKKLGVPFLGLLPQGSVSATLPVYHALASAEPSLSSEAFRNLRTMVDLASLAHRGAPLLVTSSVQEEGKTFVASNLAVVFAQMGDRVLLIDGDLRRPKLHHHFQLSAARGLSGFLAEAAAADEAAALLQNTEIPGLKVLPCGPRPPNPAELLNTPRVSALLAWARDHFDRVIIDCTPMFPISDTLLWGRHVDNGIFVVRHGRTRVRLIQSACQRLVGTVKILGVAINGAVAGGLSYTPYNYHYQQYYDEYNTKDTSKAS